MTEPATVPATPQATKRATRHVPGVDFANQIDLEHARRIGTAWVEMRRGASTAALRAYFFGRQQPLEQGQMDALDLLSRRDSRPMKELAARLRVDPSTATRAMQRLEADGLVERFTSPDDGRVVLVRLTDVGRARHAHVAARRAVAMERILSRFDPDERAVLADLLDKFVRTLDEVVPELAREQADDDRRDAQPAEADGVPGAPADAPTR